MSKKSVAHRPRPALTLAAPAAEMIPLVDLTPPGRGPGPAPPHRPRSPASPRKECRVSAPAVRHFHPAAETPPPPAPPRTLSDAGDTITDLFMEATALAYALEGIQAVAATGSRPVLAWEDDELEPLRRQAASVVAVLARTLYLAIEPEVAARVGEDWRVLLQMYAAGRAEAGR